MNNKKPDYEKDDGPVPHEQIDLMNELTGLKDVELDETFETLSVTKPPKSTSFLFRLKEKDTPISISRETLNLLSKVMGLSKSGICHFALAKLRDQYLPDIMNNKTRNDIVSINGRKAIRVEDDVYVFPPIGHFDKYLRNSSNYTLEQYQIIGDVHYLTAKEIKK